MADHLKPTLTSTYSNFVAELDGRLDDVSAGFDPAVTTPTNVPTNTIRWNSSSNKWQKYNGTAWNDLTATYAISISGNAGTVTNGLYSNGSYSNPTWLTSLDGSKINGGIAGNAGTATRLATARNINGVAFDGSAAISVNTNSSLTFNTSGTGGVSGSSFNGGSSLTVSYNTVGAPSTSGANATGTWSISITGSASSATTATDSTNTTNVAVTDDVDSAATHYLYMGTGTTGQNPVKVSSSKINFQPSTGDLTTAGNMTAYSDRRLKTDLKQIDNALDKLCDLTGYVFTRIDTGQRQTGLIAQDIQKVLPEALGHNGEYMSVAYGNLAGLIVEAIKELREEVNEIKLKINS
jgi:hypothetical protein